MKVLTSRQMQAVDRHTIEDIGIPGVVLMENAGRGVAEEILKKFSFGTTPRALVFAGKGNNGGDGYVVARHLLNNGWHVQTLVLAERDSVVGDAKVNLAALEKCGGDICFVTNEEQLKTILAESSEFTVFVDALFGTGLTKELKGLYLCAIELINSQATPVVAVDIPSGIDASNGRILGGVVNAIMTVTFAYPKIGLVSYPGAECVGALVVIDIGIPAVVEKDIPADCLLIDAVEACRLLPLRSSDGHKGTFGHLMVLAGSLGKSGAAVMTAESGLRTGAGLVSLACPESVHPSVAARAIEVMTLPLPESEGEVSLQAFDALAALATGKEALAVGPGLGTGHEVCSLIDRLIQETSLPVVIDADALNVLSMNISLLQKQFSRQVVLTPHPGEMSRLTGLSVEAIQADRFNVARNFAMEHGVVLLLKGARTLIAAPDGRVCINTTGHVGMAIGGMGDVLTGVIGSLLAQGLTAFDAATLGAYLHGLAADRLLGEFGEAGLLATDVMREIPAARQAMLREI